MIRIGELAKRAGVSPGLLRAWERRYGLLAPARSDGGFRLYAVDDLARIRRMRELIDGGVSAAEAAAIARGAIAAGAPAESVTVPAELTEALSTALYALDETAAHAAIDRLLGAVTLETFVADVALPTLREVGDRWARKVTTVGHEHFATTVLRGRLLGLARGWDHGAGSRVALACLPGELHDVGLVAFGILLWRNGSRILYFGQDTPLDMLVEVARREHCALAVVSSVESSRFVEHAAELRKAARALPIAIGGAGASAEIAKRTGTRLLAADPSTAAHQIAYGEVARS